MPILKTMWPARFQTLPLTILLSIAATRGIALADPPFKSGTIDGHSAEAIENLSGGSSGASSVRVFVEAGMWGVVDSGDIAGVGGGGVVSFFSGGKLYVLNGVHLPGECEACTTHTAVQRFGFTGHAIVAEGVITIRDPSKTSDYSAFTQERNHVIIESFRQQYSH